MQGRRNIQSQKEALVPSSPLLLLNSLKVYTKGEGLLIENNDYEFDSFNGLTVRPLPT